MPAQTLTSVENNFTKGYVTEYTGLNFPENAATDTDNCEYTLIGNVLRRRGIDLEDNYTATSVSRTNLAVSSYVWKNAGGDGNSQVYVLQIGDVLRLYSITDATTTVPISGRRFIQTVNPSAFVATGGSYDSTVECEYADGNGFLFVFHPDCDPFYISYNSTSISDKFTANRIDVQVRDFAGSNDSGSDNNRPATLTDAHEYNLLNQGWTTANPWSATSTSSVTVPTSVPSTVSFQVASGIAGVTTGDVVNIWLSGGYSGAPVGNILMAGSVTTYAGTTLTISVTSTYSAYGGYTFSNWSIYPNNPSASKITTWFTSQSNYPSNADVWWYFKDSSGAFSPGTTQANVSLSLGKAPRGHFILSTFNQDREQASGIALADVTTVNRPRTGTWFQGRVWYTGVDASAAATSTTNYHTWTSSIYFSQIVVNSSDFGKCYQNNDPTSEELFDLLPTDGGVINIPEAGSIIKLFPIQNGMLIFAANGIWFLTGSQGIGFAANDYTITKISSVKALTSQTFVNVEGLPYFWNEDGIHYVVPGEKGSLDVNSLTLSTISSFYEDIPLSSKKYARGDYDSVNYVIQWVFKDEAETDTTSRYTYNRILNFNVYNKAFYPYSVDTSVTSINGINYIAGFQGDTLTPGFKYIASYSSSVTLADERDEDYVDWASVDDKNYESYFITGYKLHGKGIFKFQIPYIYVYSNSETPTNYKIQGLWDYANTGDSGRWTTAQLVNNWSPNFDKIFRRHRIRGRGMALQIKIKSLDGEPFSIMGWSVYETVSAGV